jgi:hypothetical protein
VQFRTEVLSSLIFNRPTLQYSLTKQHRSTRRGTWAGAEAKQLRGENTRLRKLVADLQGSAAVGDPKKRVELVALKAASMRAGQALG